MLPIQMGCFTAAARSLSLWLLVGACSAPGATRGTTPPATHAAAPGDRAGSAVQLAESPPPVEPCQLGDLLDCARAAQSVFYDYQNQVMAQVIAGLALARRYQEIDDLVGRPPDAKRLVFAAEGALSRGDDEKALGYAEQALLAAKREDSPELARAIERSSLGLRQTARQVARVAVATEPYRDLGERARRALRVAEDHLGHGRTAPAIDIMSAVESWTAHTRADKRALERELVLTAIRGGLPITPVGAFERPMSSGRLEELAEAAELASSLGKPALAEQALSVALASVKGPLASRRAALALARALFVVRGEAKAMAYIKALSQYHRAEALAAARCAAKQDPVGEEALSQLAEVPARFGKFEQVRALVDMAEAANIAGCRGHVKAYLTRLDGLVEARDFEGSTLRQLPKLWALVGEVERALGAARRLGLEPNTLVESIILPAAVGDSFPAALRACALLDEREQLARAMSGLALIARQKGHTPGTHEQKLLEELMDETLGLARALRAVKQLFPQAYVELDQDDVFELSSAKHDDEKLGPRVPLYIERARFAAAYRPRPLAAGATMHDRAAASLRAVEEFERACQHNHLTCVVVDQKWSGSPESLAARIGDEALHRLRELAR